MWFSEPRKIELEIQEVGHETAKTGDRHRWRVRISLRHGERMVDPWERIVEDPFDRPERNKIHDYFETVAKRDKIDEEAASNTSCKLDGYRTTLFKSLQLQKHLPCCRGKKVEIWIREMEMSGSRDARKASRLIKSIHGLHWEHLEDISLWNETICGVKLGPTSVTVQRFFTGLRERPKPQLKQTPTLAAGGVEPFRILLVTARKHIHEDHKFDYYNPTNVLCSILKAQSELESQDSLYRIHLEVVRPGTLKEFEACLLRCQQLERNNSFQIVHFDVHGDVS